MTRRQSAYHQRYLDLGAEIVDRIGYDAPYRFTSVREEHFATRERAGMYDVYHQGAVDIKGRDATALLQKVLVNDVTRIADGKVIYSSVCKEDGGMIDDLTCYRESSEHFWLSPTPSRVDAVAAWFTEQARGMNAYVTNMVSGTGFISVQGPQSRNIMSRLTEIDLSTDALPYYSFAHGVAAGIDATVARTGYSGELGYEIFYPREYGLHVWDSVVAAGAEFSMVPCGLGALRSVRIEKKYPLYGLDLNEMTTPLEANLGWTVRLQKPAFNGRDALLRQKEQGVSRSLVSIVFPTLGFLPVPGDEIFFDGEPIGKVSSADPGYFVGKSIALGYVPSAHALDGVAVNVKSGKSGEAYTAIVQTRAAYDPDRTIARG